MRTPPMDRPGLLEAVSFSATAFLRARDWREVVDPVLEVLGQALAVTRVHLFRTTRIDGNIVRSTQAYEWSSAPEWSERDSPELKDFELGTFAIPDGPEPTEEARILVLRPEGLPDPAAQRWRQRGIITTLSTALFVGGRRWGAIGLDECVRDREWTREERDTLLTIADVFGAAMERERAEAALRESQTRLALALEGSGQGTWDWDVVTGEVLFDSTWCRMLGYEPEEIGPHITQWQRLLHPDDAQAVNEELDRHLAGEVADYETEARLRHRDGSWRWIQDRGRVMQRDAAGRPLRMVGTHTDITARKEAEREQQERAGQLRLLQRAVEQSPASIVITDARGTIVYVNSRFTQITGFSAEEALGANPRILSSGAHSQEFYRDLWETISAGREWSGEIQNRRRDGSRFWEQMSISPVLDASGSVTHYVAVKEDITARRALEEQLRQAQKLEAFGQLAGGVAHDFNNMLTVISGFAALLESELPREGESQSYLAEVQHAAKRSTELTQQLLALSRKQILKPVPLDLNELVARFQLMLKRVLGEDVVLATQITPGQLQVRADPGQLEQVLLNLAINARDAMPHGGTLTIRTSEWLDPGSGQRWAECAVADTGAGIRPEHLGRIFEPFFTTKPVGRGTGLGLSTVHGIITQSGGTVSVESQPGEGACFRVRLPLDAVDAVPPQPEPSPSRPAGGTGTILVVEDEEAVRSLAVAILERAGYHTLSAHDAGEALELVSSSGRCVDLVLADVVMPGMGGRQLSALLQARCPGARVLFMSGHTDDHVLRHGVEQQAVAFISKPFTPDSLLARVHALLEGE